MFGRRPRLLGALAALALLGGMAAGLAHGERTQHGNLIVSLDGGFAPLKLPRDRPAPVAVRLVGGLQTGDGELLPRVTRIELGLPGQGVLSTTGLPTCSRRAARPTPPAPRRWRSAAVRWSAPASRGPTCCCRTRSRSRSTPACSPSTGASAAGGRCSSTPSPPSRRPSSSCPSSCERRSGRFGTGAGRRSAADAGPLAALRPLRHDALAPLLLPRARAQLPQRLLPDPDAASPPASSPSPRPPSRWSADARSAPASPAAVAPAEPAAVVLARKEGSGWSVSVLN